MRLLVAVIALGSVAKSAVIWQAGQYAASLEPVPFNAPGGPPKFVNDLTFSGPDGVKHFYLHTPDLAGSFILGSAGVVAISAAITATSYIQVIRYTDTPQLPIQGTDRGEIPYRYMHFIPEGYIHHWLWVPPLYIQDGELFATFGINEFLLINKEVLRFEASLGVFMGEQAIPEPAPGSAIAAALALIGILRARTAKRRRRAPPV